jgi:hypothetical protein
MITIQLYPNKDNRILDLFTDKEFVHRVDSWLMELQHTKRGKVPWRFNVRKHKGKLAITFVRYEDALAFRLTFGV